MITTLWGIRPLPYPAQNGTGNIGQREDRIKDNQTSFDSSSEEASYSNISQINVNFSSPLIFVTPSHFSPGLRDRQLLTINGF